MADLKTDYLDDILAESMNGKRKFRITKSDGSTEDVTLEDISEYTQKGSNFGAGDINNTNQEVNLKFDSDDVVDPMLATEGGFAADALATKKQFDEQNKNLAKIKTYVGSDGKLHFVDSEGADSVLPFSSAIEIYRNGMFETACSGYTSNDGKYFTLQTSAKTTIIACTENPIDVTDLDAMYVKVSYANLEGLNSSAGLGYGLTKGTLTAYKDFLKQTGGGSQASDVYWYYDVSELSGEIYPCVYLYNTFSSYGTGEVRIEKMRIV